MNRGLATALGLELTLVLPARDSVFSGFNHDAWPALTRKMGISDSWRTFSMVSP